MNDVREHQRDLNEAPTESDGCAAIVLGFLLWGITSAVVIIFDVGRPDDSEFEHVDALVTSLEPGWQSRDEVESPRIEYEFKDDTGTLRRGAADVEIPEGHTVRIAYLRRDTRINFPIGSEEGKKGTRLLIIAGVAGSLVYSAWKERAHSKRGIPTKRIATTQGSVTTSIIAGTVGGSALQLIDLTLWEIPGYFEFVNCLILASMLVTSGIALAHGKRWTAAGCVLIGVWMCQSVLLDHDRTDLLAPSGVVSTLLSIASVPMALHALRGRPSASRETLDDSAIES